MASKAVKVFLIGCGALFILTIIALGVGSYLVKQWGTAKLKELQDATGVEGSEYAKKTEELTRKYSFTPPENDIISENQLVRFLAVRKQMHETYSRYKQDFKKLSDSKESVTSALKGLGMWKEVRMTHAFALESQKMSPEEYEYIVKSVYRSWFAKEARETLKDSSIQESAGEGIDKAIEGIEEKLQDPDLNETVKEQLGSLKKQLEEQRKNLEKYEHLDKMDAEIQSVPDENVQLFKKYEKEIAKYSMGGLELIGL